MALRVEAPLTSQKYDDSRYNSRISIGGFDSMSRMYNKNNKQLARQLRSNMTKEEKTLWYRYLRNCRVRFLRQKPIGNYIVDFYCPKLHLVIELDGSQHYFDNGIQYDNKRTEDLKEYDIKTVIRIPNNEISHNLSGVVELIENCINRTLSQP